MNPKTRRIPSYRESRFVFIRLKHAALSKMACPQRHAPCYVSIQAALAEASDALALGILRDALAQRPVQRNHGVPAHAPDVVCWAPRFAWVALQREASQRGSWIFENTTEGAFYLPCLDGTVSPDSTRGIRVSCRKAPGEPLVDTDFTSASALAEAWLAVALEDGALSPAVVFAGVTPQGGLVFTSMTAFREQLTAGNLLCNACGHFFAAERGLREHIQTAHRLSFAEARAAEMAAQHALVISAHGHLGPPPPVALRRAKADATLLPPGGEHNAGSSTPLPVSHGPSTRPLHPLLAAAQAGDLDRLRTELAALPPGSAPGSVTDRRGSNALHYAAGGGHARAVRLLVDEAGIGAATAQRSDGRTAAHWAARNGHADVLRWLAGSVGPAAVDAKTADGTTPLHLAAWQGHVAVVAWLIDIARADAGALNDFGCNAAHWAIMGGSVPAAAALAQRGVDMRGLNSNGHSLLHKAAQRGHGAAVVWLLGGETGLRGLLAGGGDAEPAAISLVIAAAQAAGPLAVGHALEPSMAGVAGLRPPLDESHMRPDLRGFGPAAMAEACGFPRIATLLDLVERSVVGSLRLGAAVHDSLAT